ncbi:karyopherin beta [Scheffersomyces spartinae]|uniref:Importin-95 n=1 Tax=Scheffersomyces spartinae TaxID=45513 RepID=A0A9P8AK21_9ASCO|nr:karyopherin beta [Scheffersomyces spartinae]KAG7196020.1 karyopherin beta [Scheffersomyces spartinae]
MSVEEYLTAVLFSPEVRASAEYQLEQLATNLFDQFVELLLLTIINKHVRFEVRILAILTLKNKFVANDGKKKLENQQRWIHLPSELKSNVKRASLELLNDENEQVGRQIAQLISAIGDIELPKKEWNELIPTLIENTSTEANESTKKASLLTIGYICEVADPTNPEIISQSNGILITIVQGAQSKEPSTAVRLTALNSLANALEFITKNFEVEAERNYIMQVVCEATQAELTELQASAFGCLSKIMTLYYKHMSVYMEKALYGLTVSGMHSSDDKVACMAVEFWSTVCEEEMDIAIQKEEYPTLNLDHFNFATVAIHDVVPNLLTLLTRQNEDPEDDDWSVAMAAAACLQLFAQCTGNYVLNPTLEYVSANIGKVDGEESWRNREAAVMAFGSILDGPDNNALVSMVGQALESILNLINDNSLHVKETVAWCIGKIADTVIDSLDETSLPQVMNCLAVGLHQHPKVWTNCCWALINILEQKCGNSSGSPTSIMSPYYEGFIPMLVTLSNRPDNEYSARASAYEALSAFVIFSAEDTLPLVQSIAQEVMNRLQELFAIREQVVSVDDKTNLEDVQINILALLTNVIRRLKSEVLTASDRLMEIFIKLLSLQDENSLIDEDVFIAISAVADATGAGFDKYMSTFSPYLVKALQNIDSPTCDTAIGLVADLSQSLRKLILPYIQTILQLLGETLNNPNIRRELKPAILSCFGDIANAIGVAFQPYVETVVNICVSASSMRVEKNQIEEVDYVLSVKEAVLDCYVGIVSASSEDPSMILNFIPVIFQFLEEVNNDYNLSTTDAVMKASVGILGDIAQIFPYGEFRAAYLQPWVTEFIKKARGNPDFSPQTKDTARWARDLQKRQIQLQ